MLICSFDAVAVQSKTYKGSFAIIFFICRDLLNGLWNTCAYNIIFIYQIKQSIIVLAASKSTCACYLRKFDEKSPWPPLKFQLNIKIQLHAACVSRLSLRFLWLCFHRPFFSIRFFSLYQAKVIFAFMKRIDVDHFYHECVIEYWLIG